jgi:hypothetical protein
MRMRQGFSGLCLGFFACSGFASAYYSFRWLEAKYGVTPRGEQLGGGITLRLNVVSKITFMKTHDRLLAF